MSVSCTSCAENIEAGQEICSSCLAPAVVAGSRFTIDSPPVFRAEARRGALELLPDVEAVEFKPSSPVFRFLSQFRGGLISALVAFVFIGLGGSWWIHSNRSLGQEQNLAAELFFKRGDYESAHIAWQSAFDSFEKGLDKDGQVTALFGISRCFTRTKDFSDSLLVLSRAQKIRPDESVADAIKKCHRLAAVQHLKTAQELFSPDTYGRAYLEAELAIDGFKQGEGSASQKAGAFRMASRCSLKLEDFEGAKSFLKSAIECEGKSQSNLALQREYNSAYQNYRGQVLADGGKKSYIPRSKIEPVVDLAASGSQGYQPSYPTYKPPVATAESTYPQSTYPQHSRTRSGSSGTSYPTSQRPTVYTGSQNYQRYSSSNRSNSGVTHTNSAAVRSQTQQRSYTPTYRPARTSPSTSTRFNSPTFSSPSFSR